MAGVKDEKSFYKKYPTEAAFLKAHPKAKAELKKFATGGQIGKNIGAGLYGAGEGLLDTLTFGATDKLTDMGYKALQKTGGSTEDEIREQDSIAGYAKAAGAITGGVMNPAALKNSIIETAEGVGQGVSKGSESEEWARTTGQVINAVAPIASMASGSFGGSGGAKTGINANNMQSGFKPMSSTDNIGQTQFGYAKYGGMQQYAMGGFGNPNNPSASMGVNPNNPQISMSINKVNTNPYESSPAYKAAQAANFYSTGTLYSPGAAKGMTTSELVRQHNAASKMPGYEEFGNLKYLSGNINQGTSLFEKTVNGKKSNYYYGKNKEGAFGFFPEVKTQVNNTQVNPQVNPQINPVNNIQNTAQTNIQPENRGEYTNFGQPYTSVKFKGAHGYSGNDVTYKYYDPATNREINQDLNKSFDSKGNYIPSFLEQQSNTNNMPVSTNKYGGLMQYAMGGEIQYANGGTGEINAEVEDNENAIGPNGEFTQFNGPTHAEGGIETDMAPGTMIFSDKLKMPGSKKSFAALNKLYDTNKEDNVLSSEKSNNTLKLTAMLMRDAKLKQSLALFQEQEQFKQDKVAAYAKRMGVQIPSQDNEQMEPQGMPGQSQGKMAMGGIQESDYQTDPGKLSSLLRQQKANDATILGMRSSFGRNADTNNVEDPLVVTFNKAKNYGKELADKIKNHPDNKKIEPFAMGGKLPMYYMGGDNDPLGSKPPDEQVFGGSDEYGNYIPQANDDGYFERSFPDNPNPNYKFPHNEMNRYLNDANMANSTSQPQSTFNPYSLESYKFQQQLDKDRALYGNSAERVSDQYTPAQNWNPKAVVPFDPNAGSRSGNTDTKVDTKVDPKDKGKGFDYKKAAGNLGQYALQNAGNIYDLYRSTQDNSKLNLSRVSPTFLDKTQDLQNNLRLYSEGKRQTAEASQGNASTYLNNMYANRASKLANDLNINTTYGNLNASIDNAAKLYNAGAIDKETMFKLQAEGMNRNLKGQALAGMSQNFLNQRNSDRQNALDQQRLGIQKDFYKEYWANQDRENQRKVDEITKGKSNKNSWLDCSSGNCVERTSDQTQSTQSNPYYFSERQNDWNKIANDQQVKEKMDKLKKGKK